MPPDAEVLPLEGLVEVVPQIRPSSVPDDTSGDAAWIAHHFYRLADRAGYGRDEMLRRLGCRGVATEESKRRSLAFLCTADHLTEHLEGRGTGDVGVEMADDHLDFLLDVWSVADREPEVFQDLLTRDDPSIEALLRADAFGLAMRALQLSDEYLSRLTADPED